MQSVLNQPVEKRKNIKGIRKLFVKAADLNSMQDFTDAFVDDHVHVVKDVKSKKKYLNVKYQRSNKLFKNILITIDVDESMEITSGKQN